MSLLSRSIPIVAFALALGAQDVRAQELAQGDDFRWSVGGQVGMMVYRTPSQTRGAVPIAGGHMLIKAKRGALFLAVEEAFDQNQQSAYIDYTAGGGPQPVTFSDLRRYTFGLMVFPVRGHMQPFFGVGGGILHVVNPIPTAGGSPALAQEIGTGGFATFIGGLQFRLAGLSAFGQYQLQTAPSYQYLHNFDGSAILAEGRLVSGTVHSVTGGLRISLGSSREEL
jgi:hypothetical protein